MKKTLVALAVLAASGASFAQVTLTGAFNYGYRADSRNTVDATTGVSTKNEASGLGIRDSALNFGVTEDLGSGMSIAANLKLDGVSRAGVSGGDESITLTTKAFFLTMGTAEIDSDLNSLSSNVSDGGGLDNLLLAGYTNTGFANSYYNQSDLVHDFLTVGTNLGPVAVSLTHYEGSTGAYVAGSTGIGSGAAGNGGLQRQNLIKAVYAAGPLTAEASYGSFDNKVDTAILWSSLNNVATIAGNYDLGVVKLGAGYQKTAYVNGSAQETLVSISAPLGALTLSAEYDNAKIDSNGLATRVDGTASGYALGASYAMSKRTAIRGRYVSFDGTMNPTNKDTRTEVVLKHSF
jgi:predicted porin